MPSGTAPAPYIMLRPSKLRYLYYVLVSLGFTVGGSFMIAEDIWFGWVVAGFFGLCAVVLAFTMLPGASWLRLTPEGFTICTLYRSHAFKWSEIGHCYPGVVGRRKMVLFDFADPAYSPRMRVAARALSGAEGALPDTYGMTADALATLMNDWRENRNSVA
ncbi:MAG: hypothetical protein OEZ03_15605 [Alphaproteobacteria bacterium]|nr:hypothetical protein [Alphaproteobacteria bacterium]